MKRICLALGALFAVSLTGCGGGSSSTKTVATKAAIRKQAVKSARIAKSLSTSVRFGHRAAAAVALRTRAAHTRDAGSGLDQGSGLYYVLTTNPDGSGKIDLFTDAAMQLTAGGISWPAPDGWTATSQPFPAVLHVTYAITAGTLKGDNGTEDITIKDAADLHDLIHIKLQDQSGDNEMADVDEDNGQTGDNFQGTSGDGMHFTGQGQQNGDNGDIHGNIHFDNGMSATTTEHNDGSETVNLTGQNGESEAVENNQPGGQGHIDFSNGDTGEDTDLNENDHNQH